MQYIALSNTNEHWFCSVCLATLFPFNHFEDDTDFFFALFDFNFEGNFDPELLKQKVFNPFFDDPETSHLLMNSKILDLNPNFFTTNSELLSNCIYLTSSEFHKISFPPDAFSAFHINIRSLRKHFDDLSEYLLSLNMLFSVVAVSETWLQKSNSDLFNIPGYHFISSSREHKLVVELVFAFSLI